MIDPEHNSQGTGCFVGGKMKPNCVVQEGCKMTDYVTVEFWSEPHCLHCTVSGWVWGTGWVQVLY